MTRLHPILAIIFLFGLSSFFVFKNDLIEKTRQQLKKYTTLYPQEKVYLHTDKPHYSMGETIWWKAYLVEGQFHLPDAPSNTVYVELIDPAQNVIATRNIKIEDGGGAGDFTLDGDLPEGEYVLRAYTNYMRNFDDSYFFKRSFQVFNPYQDGSSDIAEKATKSSSIPNDFDAQFFPEGGDLVNGLSSVVAVKTVGISGKSIDVQGKIVNKEGQQVAIFKSLKFGMGFFNFIPESGQEYSAEITNNGFTKVFPLPKALPNGYVLKIDSRKKGVLKVRAESNALEGMDGAFVIAQIRGNVFGVLESQKNSNSLAGDLNTAELPNGIAQFTLFTAKGVPVCERLAFINNANNIITTLIESNKESYTLREKVELEIELSDFEGKLVEGNFSMTVIDEESVFVPEFGQDIRTYLLLNSDLRGHIENPGYYFVDQSAGRRILLDLLMMTQGWRRFDWSKIMADNFPTIKHPFEKGFALGGKITKFVNNNKTVPANVFISVLGSEFIMDQVATKEDGEFLFLGLDFQDTTDIILQATLKQEDGKNRKNKKNKGNKVAGQLGPEGKRNVDILLSPWRPHSVSPNGIFTYPLPQTSTLSSFLEDQRRINVIDSSYTQWTIDLDAVVVKARKKEKIPELQLANTTYKTPDHRMILDSVTNANTATDIFQLIRGRYPGVRVQGTFPNEIITMRGVSGAGAAALILLDGLPLDAETIATINPNDVAVIDILKGASAAFYGSRGINGIVAIYSRQGSGLPQASSPSMGIINMKHPGYYNAREFYAPNYDKKRSEHAKPDFRSTLHWEPILEAGKNGVLKTKFYTSDKRSTYKITIEGLTKEGRPVRGVHKITVN